MKTIEILVMNDWINVGLKNGAGISLRNYKLGVLPRFETIQAAREFANALLGVLGEGWEIKQSKEVTR